jgi:Phage portal protein.
MAENKKTNLIYGQDDEEISLETARAQLKKRGIDPDEQKSFSKSILNVLNGQGNVERLAFEADPSVVNSYAGVYKAKVRLIPDTILKRIAIQDSLVSNIVRARQNHISSFGRARPDRFSLGFVIKPDTGLLDKMNEKEKNELQKEIKDAVDLLSTCGKTKGISDEHQATFAEYLALVTRSAVVCGRAATEVVWSVDEKDTSKKKFHHFVATDAGTIYPATHDESALESVRKEAYNLLCNISGDKLIPEKHTDEDFRWVQVIDGSPKQVFTTDEMLVYNFYAVPDVELGGFPVTPLDTVISAVTTHINITTLNKLFFQNGRATKGMLVIKSEDANPSTIHTIKQNFNASINNVNNSFRMPVFGCGVEEEISWQPLDTGAGRDMEFQYLCDLNAREILTAFMMSPDELPGWSYLSRGTNNQALSESNNEYKLQAARDVGIRPLLAGFEDFVNSHLFPLIAPNLVGKCTVKFMGLESDNAEKEAVRTQQDMQIWMVFDDILERVEKKPVGKEWAGTIPLNQIYKSYLDQYFTVGQILEHFCGIENASKDPSLAYRRCPMWLQWYQLQMQAKQMAAQAQAQQQAQAQGGAGGGQSGGGGGQDQSGGSQPQEQSEDPTPTGGQPPSGANAYGQETEKEKSTQDSSASPSASDSGGAPELARSIDAAFDLLQKRESSLPPDKRKLIAQQEKTVEFFMKGWGDDVDEALKAILDVTEHHTPKPKA